MAMTETQYLLDVLSEECNEVAVRASKAIRFGLEEIQPGQALTNAQRLALELDDLYGAIELLNENIPAPTFLIAIILTQKRLRLLNS